MNVNFHVASRAIVLFILLGTGCNNSPTAETQPVATLVRLDEIPTGILTLPDVRSGTQDDLEQSLDYLQATTQSNRPRPAQSEYYVGNMYGDGQEYLAMMSIEEVSPSLDHTYADPTTSEEYKALIERERLERPHDFDGIYSWAGPEVEGYDEVLKTLPKEDPTYKTPEQSEVERRLVETDVTDQYLAYHRRNNQTQVTTPYGQPSRSRKAEANRIPNIQEYIRAKRAGTL